MICEGLLDKMRPEDRGTQTDGKFWCKSYSTTKELEDHAKDAQFTNTPKSNICFAIQVDQFNYEGDNDYNVTIRYAPNMYLN